MQRLSFRPIIPLPMVRSHVREAAWSGVRFGGAEPSDESAALPVILPVSAEHTLALALHARASAEKDGFLADLRSIAAEAGVAYQPDIESFAVKSLHSILQKMNRGKKVTDSLRGTLVMKAGGDVAADQQKVLRALAEHGYTLVEVASRFDNPTPDGYKDINILFTREDGLVRELQLLQPNMLAVKSGTIAHYLYADSEEMKRQLRALGAGAEPAPLQTLKKKLDDLNAQMKTLYDGAFALDSQPA